MSRHTAELMEHFSFVRRQLALHHGASADKTRRAQGYKDALALPFHLDATYLDLSGQAVTGRLAYLPFRGHHLDLGGVCDYAYEPAFIRKRNERERHRVRCVNDGYARLREHLPRELEEKRLSKVETLRAAIDYIRQLQGVLERSASGVLEMSPGEIRVRLRDHQEGEGLNVPGQKALMVSVWKRKLSRQRAVLPSPAARRGSAGLEDAPPTRAVPLPPPPAPYSPTPPQTASSTPPPTSHYRTWREGRPPESRRRAVDGRHRKNGNGDAPEQRAPASAETRKRKRRTGAEGEGVGERVAAGEEMPTPLSPPPPAGPEGEEDAVGPPRAPRRGGGGAEEEEEETRCPLCDKTFPRREQLPTHLELHALRYRCLPCERRFGSRSGYYQRRRVHERGRALCPVSFHTKSHLAVHGRLHTGERPFACALCPKRFFTASCVRRHALSHNGVKPHRCPRCGKGFSQNGNLKTHMATHSPAPEVTPWVVRPRCGSIV
ncbi:unnamed protein product [Boreogadus saida]